MTLLDHQPSGAFGSLDSDRDGDHDRSYRLGGRSRANVLYLPAPRQRGFNTRQYARLLVFRRRLQDHLAAKTRQVTRAPLPRLLEAGCSGMRMAWREWWPGMDDVERVIEAFKTRPTWSVMSKLDALMDLEQIDDPRIVPFLVQVLVDQREPTEVRINVLKQLRNGRLQPPQRQSVAEAVLQVVSDRSSPDLRLQAVLALAEFTDINGVTATLGGLTLDPGETINVRYSAFTSLQRAGATAECVALLRQLSADELLGRSARSVLLSWQLE